MHRPIEEDDGFSEGDPVKKGKSNAGSSSVEALAQQLKSFMEQQQLWQQQLAQRQRQLPRSPGTGRGCCARVAAAEYQSRRKEQEEPLRPLDEDGTKVGREEERQRGCLADDRWKAGREAECAERGSLQGEERTVEEDLEIKGPLTRKWIMNKLKEKGEAARTAKEAEQSAVEEGAAEKSEVAARTVVTNNPEVPAAVNSLTGMEVSGRNGREPANEGSNAVT
ncbi:hypothetical protein PF001_g6662 [Phytophthora fragariae]|nr:hypothetical protein PF001_g6662 [Phytophthora fragariae]